MARLLLTRWSPRPGTSGWHTCYTEIGSDGVARSGATRPECSCPFYVSEPNRVDAQSTVGCSTAPSSRDGIFLGAWLAPPDRDQRSECCPAAADRSSAASAARERQHALPVLHRRAETLRADAAEANAQSARDTRTAAAAMIPRRAEAGGPCRARPGLPPANSTRRWIRSTALKSSQFNGRQLRRDAEQRSRWSCFPGNTAPAPAPSTEAAQLVGNQSAVHQGRVNPAQGGDLVRFVRGPFSERPYRLRQLAANAGVSPVQPARSRQSLFERAEDHGEHHAKGLMKAADRISERGGMFGNGGRDPGMRQLQQRRPPCRQKQRRLAIDLPTDRSRGRISLAPSPLPNSSPRRADAPMPLPTRRMRGHSPYRSLYVICSRAAKAAVSCCVAVHRRAN